MANKQRRGNREAKKPKKSKTKAELNATVSGVIDKAREPHGFKK
jgi:hypothetical protein